MDVTDATELEDLDTTINTPGWRRIERMFVEQWGRAGKRFGDAIEKAANNVDKVAATDDIQRVVWVRLEIEMFFRGIEARRNELKNTKAPELTGSRRGVL